MYPEIMASDQRLARWRQRVRETVRTVRTRREFLEARNRQIDLDESQLASYGWRALREGHIEQAQVFFRAALHDDPYTVSAWFGLSRAVNDYMERRAYLQAAFDLHHLVSTADQKHN